MTLSLYIRLTCRKVLKSQSVHDLVKFPLIWTLLRKQQSQPSFHWKLDGYPESKTLSLRWSFPYHVNSSEGSRRPPGDGPQGHAYRPSPGGRRIPFTSGVVDASPWRLIPNSGCGGKFSFDRCRDDPSEEVRWPGPLARCPGGRRPQEARMIRKYARFRLLPVRRAHPDNKLSGPSNLVHRHPKPQRGSDFSLCTCFG